MGFGDIDNNKNTKAKGFGSIDEQSSYIKALETELENAPKRIRAAGEQPDTKEFHLIPAIFEGLRRTDYAATNLLRELIPGQQGDEDETFDPVSAFIRGLKGEDKITGKQLVSDLGLSDKPFFETQLGPIKIAPSVAGIAGFGLEAFNPLNPVNWLTFGAGKAITSGAKGLAKEAGEEALERSLRHGISAKIATPIGQRTLGEVTIPGTKKIAQTLTPVAEAVKKSAPYQKLAKSFSTKYVPEDVPEKVLARTLKGKKTRKELEKIDELADFIRKRKPKPLEDVFQEVSGKQAFVDVRKAREAIEQMSRGEIDKVDKEIRELFKPLTKKQKEIITDAVGRRDPSKLPENLLPYYKSAVESLEGYKKQLMGAGILERTMEQYVPFVRTGKKLSAKQKQLLKEKFGTGVKSFDDLDDVQRWYAQFMPNIRERTTKAVTPKEVNEILGVKFFEEDIAEILSTYSSRAIKADAAKQFFDVTVAKYGLKIDDLKKLKQLPEGYGLYRVNIDPETGQRIFEPVRNIFDKMSKDVVALPQEFVNHINEYQKAFFDPTMQGTLWDFFDNINRIFKTTAYLWNPGHIPRDATSNAFQLWLMGMKNPARYLDGIRVLKGEKFVPKGLKYSSDKILQMARDYGLIGTEMITAEFRKGIANNAYTDLMARATIAVDDSARLAGFIDQLSKGLKPEQAAAQVKKYLFDYFELTPFERKWMKRFVPFYTWTRKNLPLQFQELMRQPGKYATVARAHDYLSEDYTEKDAPSWLRENAALLLPGEQGQRRYMVSNLPYMDMATTPRDLLGMVTPIVRTPFELASGTKTFSGTPIQNKTRYAVGQFVPFLDRLLTMANKEDPKQQRRILTTLGLPPTYSEESAKRSAMFELRDKYREQIQKMREKGIDVPNASEVKNMTYNKKKKGFGAI